MRNKKKVKLKAKKQNGIMWCGVNQNDDKEDDDDYEIAKTVHH